MTPTILIIGLTGPNAAGKGEAAAVLSARGLRVWSLSDIVREEARAAGFGDDRENLIRIGRELRQAHGPGVLAERILARLDRPSVVDSIRAPAEVAVLRRLPGFRLLGVDAPVELRWQRAVNRGRAGERDDLAAFSAREALENTASPLAQQLQRTLELADRVVSNAGSLDALRAGVEAALADWQVALR